MREFLEGVSLMHLQRMTGFKQLMFEPEGGLPPHSHCVVVMRSPHLWCSGMLSAVYVQILSYE